MSTLGGIAFNPRTRDTFDRDGKARSASDKKNVPNLERLEQLLLLSVGCPVISGFVFLDENTNTVLTNNGLFDPGELPIPNASVELLDANGNIIETTTTDQTGAYSFTGLPNGNATAISTTQTVSAGNPAQNTILTNFTNQPLSGPINLFDPSLGTLVSVTVTHSATLQSTITSQNMSTNSSADITMSLLGNYELNGLNEVLSGTGSASQGPITDGPYDPANPSGNGLPPVTLSSTDAPPATTFTSAADLAFFTASAGRTTVDPTFSANGLGTATAPNGNLSTSAITSASAVVSVTYTYRPTICIPAGHYTLVQVPQEPGVFNGKESQPGIVYPAPPAGTPQSLPITVANVDLPNNDFGKLITQPSPTPPGCPTVTGIVRFGVHQQQTRLVVSFNGAVDPVKSGNPANYFITSSSGEHIKIVSATYDAATNSVTLIPARRINVHYHFDLSVNLPCVDSSMSETVVVPFGGKQSLGGFTGHNGEFIPVVNGHILRPGATSHTTEHAHPAAKHHHA